MTYEGIRNVANRAAFIAGLRQSLLSDYLADTIGTGNQFEVDNPSQRLSFVGTDGRRVDTHAEMVASIAPGPRSLLWGWAHPQGAGDDRFAIKQLGERFGISELTTPEIPLDPAVTDATMDDEILELSHIVGLVATEALRDGFYYSAPTGHGPRVVFWMRGLDSVPQPTMLHIASRLPDIATAAYCTDHRSAVLGIAEHLGWYLDWRDQQGNVGVLSDPHGQHAEITFDHLGRLTNLKAKINRA